MRKDDDAILLQGFVRAVFSGKTAFQKIFHAALAIVRQ